MKAKQVAVDNSQQRRIAIQGEPPGKKGERPPKNPRVPIFPPQTVPLVNLLNQMLDNPETDGERRALAYGVLSRLCVLWAPPIMRPVYVAVDLVEYREDKPNEARGKLSPENGECINGLVTMMSKLFPDGEGLPPQEGCPL